MLRMARPVALCQTAPTLLVSCSLAAQRARRAGAPAHRPPRPAPWVDVHYNSSGVAFGSGREGYTDTAPARQILRATRLLATPRSDARRVARNICGRRRQKACASLALGMWNACLDPAPSPLSFFFSFAILALCSLV